MYDAKANFIGTKKIVSFDGLSENIGHWVNKLRDDSNSQKVGFMSNGRNDFQNQKLVYFMNKKEQMPTPRGWWITPKNISRMMIFVAVRHAIPADWLNDRDQFLTPDTECENDEQFVSDCLAYSIFSGANTIQSSIGINHWIPFVEDEVGAKDAYKSHFLIDYISGKSRPKKEADLFTGSGADNQPLVFSPEATLVIDAGRELWKYYHSQEDSNPNASLYDIKMYFQGTKVMKNGKVQMKTDSDNERYTELIKELRDKLKVLAKKIEPKIYHYGFLK